MLPRSFPSSGFLACAEVANYHQVSNGKNSSDAFKVHTSKDTRQCGKYLPDLLVHHAKRYAEISDEAQSPSLTLFSLVMAS